MNVLVLTVIRFEIGAFAVGVAVIAVYRLLTGAINLRGLLDDKTTQSFSAERLQLLFVTLCGGAYYVGACYQAQAFLPVTGGMDELIGGSSALYLIRKYLGCLAR